MSEPIRTIRRVTVRLPHHRAGEAQAIGRAVAEAVGLAGQAPAGPVTVPDFGSPALLAASVSRRIGS
ncbi:MAG: hypothetical protein V4574_06155 [Pseudomonadota bacterium]